MTDSQARCFVLTRLTLQSLKRSRRQYIVSLDCAAALRRFSQRYIGDPIPTPLTYYDVGGNARILP